MQDADCESALLTRDREKSAGGEDKASKLRYMVSFKLAIARQMQSVQNLQTRREFVIYTCPIPPSFLSAKAAGHLSAIIF